jgi:predicted nucleotidyltransferase
VKVQRIKDPILKAIVEELRTKNGCHTIVLYGSRARGLTTPTSDYDVFGVRRSGEKTRIAKKQNGAYWDVFVYSEKDLRKLGEAQFSWRNARLLYAEGQYGKSLMKRIDTLLKKPYKPRPQYEIDVVVAWAQKQLERCRMKDIQALFRRAEFQAALIDHYFFVRQKRFLGPKAGFVWLEKNDPKTFALIKRALLYPTNLTFLKAAASRVYQVSLR